MSKYVHAKDTLLFTPITVSQLILQEDEHWQHTCLCIYWYSFVPQRKLWIVAFAVARCGSIKMGWESYWITVFPVCTAIHWAWSPKRNTTTIIFSFFCNSNRMTATLECMAMFYACDSYRVPIAMLFESIMPVIKQNTPEHTEWIERELYDDKIQTTDFIHI